MIINNKYVKLGQNCIIDENAIVGYMPSRNIRDLTLIIFDKAIIRSGTIIYLGSKIGHGLETGHNVVIREENEIGNNVKIWSNTIIDYRCKIGNNVKIHSGCYVAQLTTIEDDVFLAPEVVIANEKYPTGIFSEEHIKGPIIKRGAKIGINSTILPGITIGEGAIIGAGSVVTRDVPSHMVAYGVPARIYKRVDELVDLKRK